MPTRLIREGILDSDAVNSLSWPAEVFYRRLMSVVDDFGRFDGRPSVLRSRLYPLKVDKVREADISRWIAECETAGLIALYAVTGKPYILFGKLGEPRAKESKYPSPPDDVVGQMQASARICKQTQTDENGREQTPADVPYSDSYSDANSYSDADSREDSLEPQAASKPTVPIEPPIASFPTVGGKVTEWHLTASLAAKLAEAFPGVDVPSEARKAAVWCETNPAKRKTAKGMPAFLNRWMANVQNRVGGSGQQKPSGLTFKTQEAIAVHDNLDRMIAEAREREKAEQIAANRQPLAIEGRAA
jgi:hypothetical protein